MRRTYGVWMDYEYGRQVCDLQLPFNANFYLRGEDLRENWDGWQDFFCRFPLINSGVAFKNKYLNRTFLQKYTIFKEKDTKHKGIQIF